MSQFVEKNRSLLSFCSLSAQISGWILLALWAVLASSLVSQLLESDNNVITPLMVMLSIFSELLPCLIVLVVGQFIAYMLDKEGKLSLLLTNSNIILYLYAALLAVNMVLVQIDRFEKLWPLSNPSIPWAKFFLVTLGSLLPDLVKILLLFAGGLLVKPAIWAIKKSKTASAETVTPRA